MHVTLLYSVDGQKSFFLNENYRSTISFGLNEAALKWISMSNWLTNTYQSCHGNLIALKHVENERGYMKHLTEPTRFPGSRVVGVIVAEHLIGPV